jgi:hypothetical protein
VHSRAAIDTRETIRRLAASSLLLAVACLATAGCGLTGNGGDGDEAIQGLRLYPENPRYLEFRGEPTVLITSGEHYGAVVNADFNFVRYLGELEQYGFNLTRLFSGSYIEPGAPTPSGPVGWAIGYDNTLAPRPGRFVSPWARSDERRRGGGRKFDLAKWNPAYFERLKRFVEEASRRGVVVELVLFSALYESSRWRASPFNSENNVNGVGAIEPSRLYTLDNGDVLEFQESLVRKLVTELRSFDNVYYEVINEGWAEPAPAADEWQDHIIKTIQEADSASPYPHLIARNYRHDTGRISEPHPAVSIFNFHYQRDVSRYGNLEGVLSFDETGLQGTGDRPYRTDGWLFMLSGGGIYSNLDFSFTPESEDGSGELPAGAPAGGGPSLRRSLAVLKRFLERFELPQLSPSPETVISAPPGVTTRALSDPGTGYAIYLAGGRPGPLVLDVAAGRYRAEWVDTSDGRVKQREEFDHAGSQLRLIPPSYEDDIALAIEAE